jgi:G3E family GTPase
MSRNLRFNLIHENQNIRTIDELREYCAIEQLLIDYREGKLQRWLKALRCFDDILNKINCLSIENNLEIAQELVRILEIKRQIFEDYQAKLERVNNRRIFAKDIQDFPSIFSSINNFSLLSNFFKKRGLPVTIVTGLNNSGTQDLINEMIEIRKDLKIVCLPCNYHEELEKLNIASCSICGKLAYENGKGCKFDYCEWILMEVYEILEKPEKIDYLIVEAVGLVDLLPIALTFLGTELRDMTYLDSIITIVNATDFSLDLFNTESAQSQIAYGDVIIINNTDLLNEADVDLLEARIRDMKESARILRSQKAQVPLPLISSSLGWSNIHDISNANQYLDSISLFSFESNQAFSIKKFQHLLDNQLSGNVFQGIGILWFDESPKKHWFRLSGKRFSVEDGEWNDEQQNNSLIFIGQNLNSEELNSQLLACLSS